MNIKEGHGKYYFHNGSRYEGNFKNDKPEGKGLFFYRTGEFYTGEWHNAKRHGQGSHFCLNGEIYIGDWNNDQRHGEGKLIDKTGCVFEGKFQNHVKHGLGITRRPDGKVSEEVWDKGQKVKTNGVKVIVNQIGKTVDVLLNEIDEKNKESCKDKINEWCHEASKERIGAEGNHSNNSFPNRERETALTEKQMIQLGALGNSEDPTEMILNEIDAEVKKSKQESSAGVPKIINGHKENGLSPKKEIDRPTANGHVSDGLSLPPVDHQITIDVNRDVDKARQNYEEIETRSLEFGKKIGTGGFGEIFVGRWNGTEVAIKKFINSEKRSAVKSSIRERDIVCCLKHPKIVSFYGICNTTKPTDKEKSICMVMEYMQRGSLHELIHRKRLSFSYTQTIKLLKDVSQAMIYMHERNILHRDIKSANILVDDNFNAKLCDFGLAKSEKDVKQTEYHSRVGTPNWMAPEILKQEMYTRAADVYSFGLIAWELVEEKVPNSGLSLMQIVGLVGYVEKDLELSCHVRRDFATLIKRCLTRDPTKRPTFKEIHVELERLEDASQEERIYSIVYEFFE
eukprot:CAMPEP_0114995068 /NCGR_PEP_ID=MMETSP0216-20121206/13508_1 /TAXON_ID=223996 /ORGANISM="Protocruzia adherens, Strain Boccale" /LENGTH=567 /DNA_ID=CAMNT_0002359037 /DNA_START=333 /DNA_END=2036 /DNA_ORIENTATION=-